LQRAVTAWGSEVCYACAGVAMTVKAAALAAMTLAGPTAAQVN